MDEYTLSPTACPSEPISIARSLGECCGHILNAIRTPVARAPAAPTQAPLRGNGCATTVRAAVRDETVDGVIHRRIVIDQVVYPAAPSARSTPPDSTT